jgi:hypothetical protein
MLILLWLVLCLVGVSVLLLPLVLWRFEILKRYSSGRLVACPENQQSATVSIDARHAAETGVDGCPELRLCDCTRWPERANCDQACLSKAAEAGPYTAGEVKVGTKQIYHLLIALAAFAAWCIGALWHSQFMFRARWTDAVGLTRTEVKQMVWWVWPHLLTFGVCLLFAYGVAWLLALCHRKGVLQGMLMAVLLCVALVAVGWYAIARLPHDLMVIEAGYAALATLIVGGVVGGMYNKPVLRSR